MTGDVGKKRTGGVGLNGQFYSDRVERWGAPPGTRWRAQPARLPPECVRSPPPGPAGSCGGCGAAESSRGLGTPPSRPPPARRICARPPHRSAPYTA
eukprot:356479-Prorocentrum_minimum.AAC.1